MLPILLLIYTAFASENQAKKDADFQVRDRMQSISRQLGVTCTQCHNLKNFRSDEKKSFRIAKKHIEVLDWLNTKGFAGNPKVDCFMCHRGKAQPDYREPKEH
jgi:hypothetical protein